AGNPGRLLELLEGLRPKSDEPDLRTFEWYHLWRLCHTNLRLALRASEPGNCVAYSPDGKTIAASGGGTVTLWDAATGPEMDRLPGHRGWRPMAFSPDGKLLAHTGGPTPDEVTVWDLATTRRRAVEGTGRARRLAFSPDGKTLATGSTVVKLWDVASWRELT